MDTKHTPGPWRTDNLYGADHPSNARVMIHSAPKSDKHLGTKIAEAAYSHGTSDYYVANRAEAEANARLIAAAPCQHSALIEAADAMEEAIRGTLQYIEDGAPVPDWITRLEHAAGQARAAIAKATEEQA